SGHKLSVIFAQDARKRLVTWIVRVSTGRPFLAVSKKLVNALSCRRCRMQPPRIQQKRGWVIRGDPSGNIGQNLRREQRGTPAKHPNTRRNSLAVHARRSQS